MNKKLLMLIIGIGVVYIGIIFIVFLLNSRQKTRVVPLPAPVKIQEPAQEEKSKPVEPEIEYEPKVEQGPLLM